MNYKNLQSQYDKIYAYFKTTCEPFDILEWDGRILQVWRNDIIIEQYCIADFNFMIEFS